MKQNIFKTLLLTLAVMVFFSCKKEDDSVGFTIADRIDLAPIDDAKLVEFLSTHYYNEEQFNHAASIPNFNYDIIFSENQTIDGLDTDGDEIGDINLGTIYSRTPLIDLVEVKNINFEGIDQNLYILDVINDDALPKPKFCDSTYLVYKGMDLGKNVFDNQVNPIWLDLAKTVKGFSESVSEFNSATSFSNNGDGTFTYNEYGVGAVFMPSGLGYYASPPSSIPIFSPLIFSFKVFGYTITDHDGDHVPSYIEDLNQDHNLTNDNTDGNALANFGDTDDDGDGVLTKDEDLEPDTDPLYDSNGDGDPANDIGDGDPTNDDTDNDGVPNYLDSDSTQSRND